MTEAGAGFNRVRAGFRGLIELAKKLEGEDMKLRRDLEAKAMEIEEGKSQLNLLKLKIEEKNREVCDREKRIEELEKMVRVNDDVKSRVEELKGLEEMIAKCDEEVRLKKGRISLIQKSMMQCSYTLEAREEKMRESNVAFGLVKKAMEEWCCKVEMKERELERCVAKLELKEEEVEKKIEELELIEKRVKDCLDDVELKVEHSDAVEKLIQEGRQQLDALQESVREGERNLDSVRKAAEEREKVLDSVGQGLEMKERELEQQANELEFKERQVELRVEEVNSKDKRVNERLNEVQMKEIFLELFEKSIQEDKEHLDLVQKLAAEREKQSDSLQTSVQDRENNLFSLQKSVQEREKKLDSLSDGLQRRERELEKQAKELELKQKQLDSRRKAKHLEPTPVAKNASVVSSTSDQSWINMDGRSLQLVMNEQVEKIDLTGSRMSAVLQASSDPAKLVLDAMQGFYPSNLTVENREFESQLRVIRKSCILLLQELKRMSPLINPQVREEAVKLAADWKEKMAVTADNSWEALGFLRLITTYELISIYDLRELRSLLAMVSQPEQAAELSRALGITDKAPGTNVVSSIVKTERSESSLARNEATLSPPNKYLQNERIVSLPSIAKTEGPKSFGARFAATLSSPNNAEGPESSLARNEATC
ncbi:FRIGIDA-like protein 5 [Rosa rugosa]|uniref:FRIGIDA-like protein 5 n=1 Tax=Rosa rugosa TaxID=74645 RepID=UPI002B403BF6|nr:FRIGIDA-like protein 5 [Rosa rugosa]